MKGKKDVNVPMPGEEQYAKKHKRHGKHDHDEKPKKKKRKHRLIWIIILLVLIIGILLGILIDRGILFPGGQGWIGGLVEQATGKNAGPGKTDIINHVISPVPDPVPTKVVDETAATAYIRVKGNTVYMNDYEVSADGLLAQLETTTYEKSQIILIDDGATKQTFENIMRILDNLGRQYDKK